MGVGCGGEVVREIEYGEGAERVQLFRYMKILTFAVPRDVSILSELELTIP